MVQQNFSLELYSVKKGQEIACSRSAVKLSKLLTKYTCSTISIYSLV